MNNRMNKLVSLILAGLVSLAGTIPAQAQLRLTITSGVTDPWRAPAVSRACRWPT
ncbi:MAG: hypothetical protein K0Q92_2512 [Steroidobacteraceae bacterium]|nr:hypothetical protein [Steroidobacteraceae bacterium]